MSKRPKPKSTAILMNLPPERQEQIAEWCAKPNDVEDGKPIPLTGGLAFARAQLAADGCKVSLDTLSRFFSWWQLEQDLSISFEREQQVLEKTGDAKLARTAGETLLMRLGLATQEPKLIQAAATIADSRRSLDLIEETGRTKARQKDAQIQQKEKDLTLSERRIVILEKKAAAYDRAQAALKEAKSSKGGVTPETLARIERELNLL